jgi:hypothetical protein
MGIDIESKLMLVPRSQGALHEAVRAKADEEFDGDFHTALEELGLDYASPWFDADIEDLHIGVELPVAIYPDLIDLESNWWGTFFAAQTLIGNILGEEIPDTKLDSFQHVW